MDAVPPQLPLERRQPPGRRRIRKETHRGKVDGAERDDADRREVGQLGLFFDNDDVIRGAVDWQS